MYIKNLILPLLTVLMSCTDNQRSNNPRNTIPDSAVEIANSPRPDGQYCYIRTEGTSNQDTTTVHILIKGADVKGEMNWIPYEKDSRRGKLKGKISGDEIVAVWNFMQEGIQDSITVMFKWTPKQLSQKPLTVSPDNGRQETDTMSGYTVQYNRMDDCLPNNNL